jgi:hypothetical protein
MTEAVTLSEQGSDNLKRECVIIKANLKRSNK